ncbi:MAG: NPCBM/NEW2 domain-containing protein [Acutalibacteraceae bacterium]|nr:NPCBM/NEW2 domain-containing protein [Acutalibacteraceae bacterium]
MGKQKYTRGFVIGATEEYGTVYYNLDGKYTNFTGIAGNLDGVNQAATYGIYGDDKLLSTIEVKGAALPEEFSIDVSGVRQLKIICGNKDLFVSGYNIGFADAVFT